MTETSTADQEGSSIGQQPSGFQDVEYSNAQAQSLEALQVPFAPNTGSPLRGISYDHIACLAALRSSGQPPFNFAPQVPSGVNSATEGEQAVQQISTGEGTALNVPLEGNVQQDGSSSSTAVACITPPAFPVNMLEPGSSAMMTGPGDFLENNPYMMPPGDFFPFLQSPVMPHLLEQRMYSVREICAHFGLKCSAESTKEGWRFRDRTRALFLNMHEDQRRFIRNHPVHNVLVHRMPAKMLTSDFARNILILGFHFMLKDGQLPQFWRKTQFRRSALLARLRPEDMVPQNNIAVAEVAHYLWVQHRLPFKVAMDEALARAERNQQLSMMELCGSTPLAFPPGGMTDFDPSRLPSMECKDLMPNPMALPSLLQSVPPLVMWPNRDTGMMESAAQFMFPDASGMSLPGSGMPGGAGMSVSFPGLSMGPLSGMSLPGMPQQPGMLGLPGVPALPAPMALAQLFPNGFGGLIQGSGVDQVPGEAAGNPMPMDLLSLDAQAAAQASSNTLAQLMSMQETGVPLGANPLTSSFFLSSLQQVPSTDQPLTLEALQEMPSLSDPEFINGPLRQADPEEQIPPVKAEQAA